MILATGVDNQAVTAEEGSLQSKLEAPEVGIVTRLACFIGENFLRRD
jgi:hypothetical protein